MPIAFVQSTAIGQTGSSTVTIAYASANTAGNLLVAVSRTSATQVGTTVVDSAGNSWVRALSNTVVSQVTQMRIWHVLNCLGSTNRVTFNIASSARSGIAIHEYSGLSPTLGSDTQSFSTGTSTLAVSGNIATTQASELLVGGVVYNSNTNAKNATNGFLNFMKNTTGRIATAHRIETSTGSTVNAAFESSGATPDWGCAVISYQTDAVVEGPDLHRFCLLGVQ